MNADEKVSAFMKKNDPAFPISFGDYAWPGMSMRDYFAAKAMQGFCSNPNTHDDFDEYADVAISAYELADALLKERAK